MRRSKLGVSHRAGGTSLYTLLRLVRTNEGVIVVTRSGQANHGDLLSNTTESLVYTLVYMAHMWHYVA